MGKVFARVYREVKRIPLGQTATYGEIARRARTTPRVVGFALRVNPDPQGIPCHRVVYQDGSLAESYAFGGKKAQQERLAKEGVVIG